MAAEFGEKAGEFLAVEASGPVVLEFFGGFLQTAELFLAGGEIAAGKFVFLGGGGGGVFGFVEALPALFPLTNVATTAAANYMSLLTGGPA